MIDSPRTRWPLARWALARWAGEGPLQLAVCSALCALACAGWPFREPRPAPALDVVIHPFDPGPARGEPPSEFDEFLALLGFRRVALPVSSAVRRAESHYLPALLAQALADEGSWGAIWILPDAGSAADVDVRARIVQSDGGRLVLEVEAVDASGDPWLRQSYDQEMALEGYRIARALPDADPARPLFDAIARDLARERDRRGAGALRDLRRTTELRFASALAPDRFAPYLHRSDSGLRSEEPPAELAPDLARARQLRRWDARVAQALTQQYTEQAGALREPYREWRTSSLEQLTAFRRSLRQAGASVAAAAVLLAAGAVLGNNAGTEEAGDAIRAVFGLAGIYAAEPGVERVGEARARIERLAEQGGFLESRGAVPFVVALGEQRVRFTGTAGEQLQKWQQFLSAQFAQLAQFAAPPAREEGLDLYFESTLSAPLPRPPEESRR
jgi:hypothetical protein